MNIHVNKRQLILDRLDRIDTKFIALNSVEGNCYALDLERNDLIQERSELIKQLKALELVENK